jgi:hypothetical protein
MIPTSVSGITRTRVYSPEAPAAGGLASAGGAALAAGGGGEGAMPPMAGVFIGTITAVGENVKDLPSERPRSTG